MTTETTAADLDLYTDYPPDLASIAREVEATIVEALDTNGSAALRLELPSILTAYRSAALALLCIATDPMSNPPGVLTNEFTAHILHRQLTKEADIARANAQTRVMRSRHIASVAWKEAVDLERRRTGWSSVQ